MLLVISLLIFFQQESYLNVEFNRAHMSFRHAKSAFKGCEEKIGNTIDSSCENRRGGLNARRSKFLNEQQMN